MARDRSPRSGTIASAYGRFMRIRGEPREIALGLALGVMVGMTPFLGFHTVIALFLATLLKWSRITATAGVFITNPLTAPFIYPVTYLVGHAVWGLSTIPSLEKAASLEALVALIKSSPLILVDLTVGGVLIGLPLSLLTYWVTFKAVQSYRAKLKPKLQTRRERRRAAKAARSGARRSGKKRPAK